MVETTVMEASPEFHTALLDSIPHLRAFARSLTRNRDRADDLVHDAAVRALAAAHQFTPGSNFKAWIFTILRNRHYNEIRKHHSRNVPFDEAPEKDSQPPRPRKRRLNSATSGAPSRNSATATAKS